MSRLNPPCVARPGFLGLTCLWFAQTKHEPLDVLPRPRDWYRPWHPAHVRVDRGPYEKNDVEHVVASVCRHCRRPYWERYDYAPDGNGSISWNGSDEIWPRDAQRVLDEAYDRWVETGATA